MPDLKLSSKAEWHTLKDVLMYEPGIEVLFSLLSPKESLYGGPMQFTENSRNQGLVNQYRNVVEIFKTEGVKVHNLKDLVLQNPKSIEAVKDIIKKSLIKSYSRGRMYSDTDWNSIDTHSSLISEGLPPDLIWTVLTTNPILSDTLRNSYYEDIDPRHRAPVDEVQPLGNLFYMRDQQFVTGKGLVIGKMKFKQRESETSITRMAFESLNIKPLMNLQTHTDPNVTFEGGDFMPAGDFVLIGHGDRTSQKGYSRTIEADVFGVDEVAVIFQKHGQDGMHLDTYFNIVDEGLCTVEESKLEYKVHVFKTNKGFRQDVENPRLYETERKQRRNVVETTLGDYLKSEGYSFIDITSAEQAIHASNFLTIGRSKIVAPDFTKMLPNQPDGLSKRLEKEGVDVIPVDVSELVQGYGSVHSLTCVLRRD